MVEEVGAAGRCSWSGGAGKIFATPLLLGPAAAKIPQLGPSRKCSARLASRALCDAGALAEGKTPACGKRKALIPTWPRRSEARSRARRRHAMATTERLELSSKLLQLAPRRSCAADAVIASIAETRASDASADAATQLAHSQLASSRSENRTPSTGSASPVAMKSSILCAFWHEIPGMAARSAPRTRSTCTLALAARVSPYGS